MKTFFDSSALVPVVTDQLPNHPAALETFVSHTGGKNAACTSAHALAECYATLTALPLSRRISGPEALHLIEVNFLKRLGIISLSTHDTLKAIRLAASLDKVSGQIYDAPHIIAARKANSTRIYSYYLAHFRPLSNDIEVTTP
jgi:predicted nucleic acid-binding protein